MKQTASAFSYAFQDPLVITILTLCLVVFILVLSILLYLFLMQPPDQFLKAISKCPFNKNNYPQIAGISESESAVIFIPNSYLYAYNCNYPGPPKIDAELPDYK